MRRYAATTRNGALLGTSIGLGIGLLRGSLASPWLSLTYAMRPAAVGWLVGALLSILLAWARSRRGSGDQQATAVPTRRLLGAALSVLALAPAALWLAAAVQRGPLAAARDPADGRPNIVFITIDALRADHLGCYGSDRDLTPSLDSFAQEATRYDAAYVSSPWTLTSFASIFTQSTPAECGMKALGAELHDWYTDSATLPEGIPLLPEQLRDAGYTTAAELTNYFLAANRGWDRGFDHFRNEADPELQNFRTRAETVTRNALSWLRLNRREPFFLWVHYIDPHTPYDSPDTPAELKERYRQAWPTQRQFWYDRARGFPESSKARYREYCRALYAEEVRYADRWTGKFLEGSREAADFDNCLVVISSDHGEELFDHEEFEHGHTLCEEVLRVPLLIKWPAGEQADRLVSQNVGVIGLARTLLDAAEVPPDEGQQSLALPRREGGAEMEIYSEGLLWGVERTSLITGDYKVIYHPFRKARQQRFEVYDRRRDRAEQHDLSHTEEAAEVRERLVELTEAAEAAARRWQASGQHDSGRLDLSEEGRRQLKALGYVGE